MGQPEFKMTGLTGREYKMMLKPRKFAGPPEDAGARFWKKLKPILDEHAEEPESGFDKMFGDSQRTVCFRDTDKLLLDAHGYSLRVREEENSNEVSLKLRTTDIFQSGTANLNPSAKTSNSEEISTKFEEDIAPLLVQTRKGVVGPAEASIRSRFSRSTKRTRPKAYELERFRDAVSLFPTLDKNLEKAGAKIRLGTQLNRGPTIQEHVFKTRQDVSLKDDIEVGFALTLWYFDRDKPQGAKTIPTITEISFQWALGEENKITGGEAARALALFIAMQEAFAGWIDTDNASKTKLGLPERKGAK